MRNVCAIFLCFSIVLLASCNVEYFQNSTLSGKSVKTTLQTCTNLIFKQPDEWEVNNQSKMILPKDNGYYYYIEKWGADGHNRVLIFNYGDGQYVEQSTSNHFIVYFSRNDIIYGYDIDLGICKYENKKMTSLGIKPSCFYFEKNHIYFSIADRPIIYRADYEGQNITMVATLDMGQTKLKKFIVYQNKLWFNHIEQNNFEEKFSSYNLQTKEYIKFDSGKVGRINNGWMYYLDNTQRLFRFNCNTYAIEQICEKSVEAFDFYNNNILYVTQDSLYRLNSKENIKILSVDELGDSNYFWNVQCQNGRIFIASAAGALYTYLAEVNIDGKIINKIHETSQTDD